MNSYEILTNHIISKLETGVIPWRKDWKDSRANGGGSLPYNLTNGKAYRGINVMTLLCSGYSSNGWATYKQAQSLGYQVRKGETSTPVVFWSFPDRKVDPERAPWMKLYRVFNVEQLDGVPGNLPLDAEPFDGIAEADAVTARYMASVSHPTLAHGGSSAYYAPSKDHVQMPPQEAFKSREGYYSTLFHEFVHSTGARGRCEREELNGIKRFGDLEYSKEELTAEFGAAFLCGEAGISNEHLMENQAAYIQGWLKKLESDKTFAVQAAQRAQRAADYILGRSRAADSEESQAVSE
jgi:antirestriction protein ArdC